jgi:hypothetical protein
MDIRLSEHEKRMLRLGLTLIKAKLGKKAQPENIYSYLMSSKCDAILETVKMIDFISDNIKSKHQSNIIREYSKFAIWVCCNIPDMRIALEGAFNKFTKFKNVEIDLEPCATTTDTFVLEHAINYLMKKLTARPTFALILSESVSTVNPIAKYAMDNIDEAFRKVKYDFIHSALKSISWLIIWIAVNDTAYRAQAYYMIKHLGNPEMSKLAETYYFEPKDWYINIHTDAHKETEELWRENKIPRHENAFLEDPCMAKKQKDKIDRILRKIGGAF